MRLSLLLVVMCLAMGMAIPVRAQDGLPADLPPLPAAAMAEPAGDVVPEGEPIKLTSEGPAVIKLDKDAASIIIGNPAHATAVLENPRLIMLMPQQPGATKLMALDHDGKAILNRHVLVGGGKSKYLRINRVCATATAGACKPVSVYYCPDRCYETVVPEEGAETAATGDVSNPVADTPENPSADTVSEGMSVIQ